MSAFSSILFEVLAPTLPILSLYILLPFLVTYIVALFRYHYTHVYTTEQSLPPKYPYFLPWLGHTIPFVFNNSSFFRTVTSYAGRITSARITVAGQELYVFEDRDTLKRLWRNQNLSSPIPFYVHVLRHFFGMHENALETYQADNSGPFEKPFEGSNVADRNRVDRLTHQGFKTAFTGPALNPTAGRFKKNLNAGFEELKLSQEWTEMPDFFQFFRDVHGTALFKSIFGPSLLAINPSFMKDVWTFDDSVPWLARMTPSFLQPEPYRVRLRLREQLKKWYKYARTHFHESQIDKDGDGDPYWGSNLIRYQQKAYLEADNFDDDALASADLALLWGVLGNATPATMLSTYHVLKDASLLSRVRERFDKQLKHTALVDANLSDLIKDPLVSSVQAEVLRLYVNVCVMVNSPHSDVPLGKWWMPKGSTALVHSSVTHKDERFWNTQDGNHPVQSFWADRFITDPNNKLSGPVLPELRDKDLPDPQRNEGKPYFSLQGLEASWMPYGGGNAICPGRLLAKRVIAYSMALMVTEYEVEFHPHKLEFDNWKFGMGIDKPKHAIPFRIRRRAQ